ncbi:MAG: transposase [Planctomycetota bacterium]|nr:transposase [Planctomycetota bacterium]
MRTQSHPIGPRLTLFLRQPGALLDNNICERALKKAILHRNSLFYKTQNGALVGELVRSLIYTCELCDANPFDYLTQLQRNADEVAAHAGLWMPWNHCQPLGATQAAAQATALIVRSVPSSLASQHRQRWPTKIARLPQGHY